MTARISRPAKTAMQSGTGGAEQWLLEHAPVAPAEIDPLMGWTSSSDTSKQVKLWFDSREAAIAYAERMGIAYTVLEPTDRRAIKKSYADNFKFGRIGSWTH
jgi:hypothetical protein